ncbi:uncharacterized protein LOC120205355 [Hibiscus syriacus]|uniref:uncharacterized protein LOC120205355 n=1 Tax=Hibiscus syriacus TaxID=106335 RepID=UPI0019223D74|nr:uncharacterized protein LOC120205355 [Hibiscus syriacus]
MGCGVSRFDNAGREDKKRHYMRIVHRKNDPVVVISKPLSGDDEGEYHSRGKVKSDGKERDCHKEECVEDDGSYIPHSPSFRVYCTASFDDNTQGDSKTDKITNKQGDHQSNKGSSTRLGSMTKTRKGPKTILRA